MARSKRRELIDAIGERLVPRFHALGFASVPLARDEKGTEVEACFPFGRLRRPTATGYDLVEIQLDKHRADAFRLNFARIPAEGIVHAVGPVKADDVWVHYLEHFCELYASRIFRRWFAPRKPFGGESSADEIVATVERVAGLIPQIDTYFSTGRTGRNIRCV